MKGLWLTACALATYLLLTADAALAADWPVFRQNNQRSAVTAEQLKLPLGPVWTRTSTYPPRRAWPLPAAQNVYRHMRNLQATRASDTAFHPVVAGGKLYYGSSADDTLHCVDAATGATLWTFTTEGPVRLAPAISGGKAYVGSDDGHVYCLDAATGRLIWKVLGGPEDRRLPGNGRIISAWPVRCGVLVADGIVYFGVGVFPSQGVYLCAVEAATGKTIWKQKIGSTIEGHLLATEKELYVLTGRVGAELYDRATGKKLSGLPAAGSAFALLADGQFASGPNEAGHITRFDVRTRKPVNVGGRRMLLHGGKVYIHAPGSLWQDGGWKVKTGDIFSLAMAGGMLIAGGANEVAAYNAADGKRLWTGKTDGNVYGLAIANGSLFASTDKGVIHCFGTGGEKRGTATDSAKPKSDGSPGFSLPSGPASAKNRDWHQRSEQGEQRRCLSRFSPSTKLGRRYAKAADEIVKQAKVAKGYCLVLDCGDGQLAYELAKRTKWRIIGVESDPKKVKRARKLLRSAGLYGGRVVVHQVAPGELPYQKYIANVITSDTFARDGRLPSVPSAIVQRVLRPDGGVLVFFGPMKAAAGDVAADKTPLPRKRNGRSGPIPKVLKAEVDRLFGWYMKNMNENIRTGMGMGGVTVNSDAKTTMYVRRRPWLSGAGEWTHLYANTSNTASSNDADGRGPLALQWFGRPGPRKMVDRHNRAMSPVYSAGRLFVSGLDHIVAADAYNGTILWRRDVPDSVRLAISKDCGSLAAAEDAVYLASGARCIAFDAETGEQKTAIDVPMRMPKVVFDWGYVACSGDQLFGTAAVRLPARRVQTNSSWTWGYLDRSEIGCSYELFSFDRHKGRQQWTYTPRTGVIVNPTITIANGRIYFVESANAKTRKTPRDRIPLAELLGKGADVVAVDARTGRTIWRTSVDLKALQHTIFLSHAKGTLLISGSKNVAGGGMRYDLLALDATTGERRWATTPATNGRAGGSHGEQDQHPSIVGDIIYYKTFAVDLKTGERAKAWKGQGGGCGTVATSAHSMFYRSGNPIMTDLATGKPQRITVASRPGCWINIIPAGGLVLVPEASSGCTCGYPIQTSFAMARVSCAAPKIEMKDLSAKTAAVTISHGRGDVIVRYTTDGSLPTANSPAYAKPLKLGVGIVVRARAFSPDGEKSVAAELAIKPPEKKK